MRFYEKYIGCDPKCWLFIKSICTNNPYVKKLQEGIFFLYVSTGVRGRSAGLFGLFCAYVVGICILGEEGEPEGL